MKEKLQGAWESVKDFWNRTSKKRRILYLAVVAAILAVSLGIVLALNNTEYVVLYEGLSPSESAEVIAQLQEMGISYELRNNRLMIREEDEMSARMQMAYKGYPDSGFDYSTFEKGGSLTATQYEKQQYTLYQLQERLQATIKTFDEVSDATVTISMPERNSFVLQEDKTETRAAVKLQVKQGKNLTAQQVQAIVNIVRDSVPGLEEENISISDQSGDLRGVLDNGLEPAARKLALTEQINDTVSRRVKSMIGPAFGDDRVFVAVNTVLDLDQKVTEENTYIPADPENPTNNPYDYVERFREKVDANGYAAEGVPGANDNVEVPAYPAQRDDQDDAAAYSEHEIFDFLVSSVRNQIISEGYEITDMTVAVVIDSAALQDGDRDRIIDTVAAAAGVPRDKVSVQNIEFSGGAVAGASAPEETLLQQILVPLIIAIAAAVVILIMVLVFLSNRRKRKMAEEGAWEDGILLDFMEPEEEEFEPINIPETQEQKLKAQIRDLANSDPEIVAQLIKTWLIA